ncbi:MAG: Ig-like domain-containing protein [Terracidiphilus sp.]
MRNRSLLGALLLIGVLIPITSCISSPSLTSIVVSPTAMNFGGAGLTTQLTAIGYYTRPNHAPATKDITNEVNWASSSTDCVTVTQTGFITSGGNICSNILVSATEQGFHGVITGTMTVNVTQPNGGSGGGGGTGNTDVSTIAIIPTTQSVQSPGQTAQFLAIGTTSSGATVNLTNLASWTSSSIQIATINAAGLATGVSKGLVTITALYTNQDGTTATGTATFTVVNGGGSEQFTALTITPGSQSLSATGQTGQFIALGTSGSTGLVEDVTSSSLIAWTSTAPSIATVTNTGLVQGVSVGSTTITALLTNTDGSVVTANASIAVSLSAAPEPLLSLTIIPGSITVGNLQATGQFLAIGTFSTAPYVRDLTNSVQWLSSTPNVFPVGTNSSDSQGKSNAGVASAYGNGSAVIIAEATATDGSVQTATSTFSCPLALPDPTTHPPTPGSCFPGSEATALLSTLTVYNEGLNTTNWEITAPSATGTPNVLHCGPGWTGAGGSVCTATFPSFTNGLPTQVVLTSPAGAGAFGGWSTNCAASNVTAGGPNTCTVTLTSDETVGAIIN